MTAEAFARVCETVCCLDDGGHQCNINTVPSSMHRIEISSPEVKWKPRSVVPAKVLGESRIDPFLTTTPCIDQSVKPRLTQITQKITFSFSWCRLLYFIRAYNITCWRASAGQNCRVASFSFSVFLPVPGFVGTVRYHPVASLWQDATVDGRGWR